MKLKRVLAVVLFAVSATSAAYGQGYYYGDSYSHSGLGSVVDDVRYSMYEHMGDVRNDWDRFTGARRVPRTDYYLGDALRYPMDAVRDHLYRPGYNDGQPVTIPWPGRW